MFGSRTILEHIARGVIGFGAITVALLTPTQPLLWLVAVPVAALMFRGCPTCWTVGLVETVVAAVRGRPSQRTCTADGCDPLPRSHGALDSSRGAS